MAYQTLYLKYRSQTFADLVGQDAIAHTLQNAVAQGRVAHAYLFSGVRGTGKTSTARILAKAINCLDRRGAEPCGLCAACVEVGSGAAVDLVEIDAASNRGIDEIRDLRERVKYLPAVLKVKVYIIDEAHMLTTEAFNALLKTLEEPPAHVLFVLATTEPHKIPLTVASRCQRFDFRRIEADAIGARLARIAAAEGVRVDPESLSLLARLARGSMRDGITVLDQLISQGAASLTLEKTRDLLGLADSDTLVEVLALAMTGDAAGTLGHLQRFYDAGGDVRQLVRGLLQAIREAALLSVGYREKEGMGGTAGSQLERIARTAGRQALLGLWKGLMEMEPELRKGADARLLLEVTLLQSMSSVVEPARARPTQSPLAAGGRPAVAEVGAAAQAATEPESVAAESESALMPAEPIAAGGDGRWEFLKGKLPKPVSSLLMDARLTAATPSLVRIEFKYPSHLELMQKAGKKEMLAQAAREVFGEEARVELLVGEREPPGAGGKREANSGGGGAGKVPAEAPGAASGAGRKSLTEDPVVKDAVNRFDAVNVRVRPR